MKLLSNSFLKFFPIPEFLLISTSGVSVSDDSVRLVQFKRGVAGELHLIHCGETTLSPGVVEGGYVENPEVLTQVLRELKNKYGITYIHATLPEEKSYLFTTYLDKVSSKALRDEVAFVLEENVPVALSESVFDFEVIEQGSDQVRVVVSVLPTKVVETYYQVFEDAGVIPVSFEIESQAIARAVLPAGDTHSCLIINIGEKKTGLYIVEDGAVQFSLTPSYGARKQGDSHPDINDLKTEIRKLFVFWNTRMKEGIPQKKIEKVVVCGSSARDEYFVRELMQGLDTPYIMADVWKNVFSLNSNLPELSFDKSLGYAAAVGLALRARNPNV